MPENASLAPISDAPSDAPNYDALFIKCEQLDKISKHIEALYWRMGYRSDSLENAVEYTLRNFGFKPVSNSLSYSLEWEYRDGNPEITLEDV